MRRNWNFSFTLALVASTYACSRADDGPDRLTAVSATVQLLSVDSQQVVTPSGLTMKVIASVEPPVVESTTVQANSFWLDSTMGYIAYNNAGLPIVGAIDVVDLTAPTSPRLVSKMSFPTEKINGLVVSQGWLYYTGSDSDTGGAVIGRISVAGSGQLGAASAPLQLPSYAGTGVTSRNGKFYATSGDTGDLSSFDANLQLGFQVPLADARGVAVSPDGKSVGVVSGRPGAVALVSPAGNLLTSYALGGASIAESKSTIQMGARLTLASLGDGGFALMCSQNGAVLATQPAVTMADASTDSTVTNSVAAGPGLVFAANGAAGVFVYQLIQGPVIADTNCTADTLTLLGHLDLGKFSANMVYFRNNYLFLADGLGGFQIISVQNVAPVNGDENDFVNPGTGLVALNVTASSALNLVGNANLTVNDGFVYVDSTSTKALVATGNAKIDANATFVTGGKSVTGNSSVAGSLVMGATPIADPLAWLPVPSITGMTVAATSTMTVTDNNAKILSSGVYQKGINLSGNAQVTLNPGIYYLSEGGLTLSGNASLTGQGVLIYNASTSTGISLSGNGNLTLTPMTTGTYAGVTIYQNRASAAAVSISGNGNLNIRGMLYMAHAPLSISGNAQLPTLGSLDVADTITVNGNGSIIVSQ